MTFIQAQERIVRWLMRCGVAAVNGRVLDAQGCCNVALQGCPEILVMLPANQTCVYLYGLVCDVDMARDNGVLSLAMMLNLDPAYTRGAALGFDPDRRQVLLRAVYPLGQATDDELDRILRNIGDLTRQLNAYFERYRQQVSDIAMAESGRRPGGLRPLNALAQGRGRL